MVRRITMLMAVAALFVFGLFAAPGSAIQEGAQRCFTTITTLTTATTTVISTITQTVTSTSTVTVTSPSTTTSAAPSIFNYDPAGGDLKPWVKLNLGSGDILTQDFPNGGTSPGAVTVYNSAKWGNVVRETVTPTAQASPAASTDSVYLWYLGPAAEAHFAPPETTWIHYEEVFPADTDPFPFRPLPSAEANPWSMEFHNDTQTYNETGGSYPSSVVAGVFTDAFFGEPAGEKLILRLTGGLNAGGSWADWHTYREGPGVAYVPIIEPIQRDHLYDIKLGIKWGSTAATGHMTAIVDGVTKYDQDVATLTITPSGHVDHPTFELNNYRPHDTVDSTVYYRRVRVADTQANSAF